MGRKILVLLANVVAFSHSLTYLLALLGFTGCLVSLLVILALLSFSIGNPVVNIWPLKIVLGMLVYAIEIGTITFIGQALFSSDCPARVFEYCLRSLARQEFSYSDRCHTMKRLIIMADCAERSRLYRRLLGQSGAFLAAAVIVLIASQIVIIF